MLSDPFYHQLLRKYVTAFGYIFSNIRIERSDNTGTTTELIKVPITYGPKDKMLARVNEDPSIDKQTAIQLPIMAFEMGKINYDGTRKLPPTNRYSYNNPNDTQQRSFQYAAVPYNIDFALSILIKNVEDGTKIVEQILPFFTPDWTLQIQLIPEMNIIQDIPIVLNTVNLDDVYDGDFKVRRSLVWTLNFTLKGYLYGPTKTSKIIKYAFTNFYTPPTNTAAQGVGQSNVVSTISVTPGLLANGYHTSNASLSVPVSQILANNDYGFITVITDT